MKQIWVIKLVVSCSTTCIIVSDPAPIIDYFSIRNNANVIINLGGSQVTFLAVIHCHLRGADYAQNLVSHYLHYHVHCGSYSYRSHISLCALHSELCGYPLFAVHAFS